MELHSFVPLATIVRMVKFRSLRWASHLTRIKENRSVLQILTGKHIGKRPFGRIS